MVLNTTSGPRPKGDPNGHVINTSRIVEEELVYEDEEPEILAVLPATGWTAVVGGEVAPLVAFVAVDSGRMYGVGIGEDGRVDLVESDVEKQDGFTGYVQAKRTEGEVNA